MFILFFSEKKAQLHQLEPSCLKKKIGAGRRDQNFWTMDIWLSCSILTVYSEQLFQHMYFMFELSKYCTHLGAEPGTGHAK
jgi:hypothetical protein